MPKPRYQYKREEILLDNALAATDEYLTAVCNELEDEGWEVLSITPWRDEHHSYISVALRKEKW